MDVSSVWTRWQRTLATRSSRKTQRPPQIGVEALEPRELLAANALFLPASGELSLDLDSSESVRIRSVGGNVVIEASTDGGLTYSTINSVGTLPAVDVRSINILGGDDANTIDLGGVSAADFTSLTSIVVDGASGDDRLIGSPDFGDSLLGGNGKDTIQGQGGNDTINGGDGNDSIAAGTGDDSILAGDGNDSVFGEDGNDFVNAGNGQDTVSGGSGNDSVEGQNGQDSLLGDAGDDTINGDGGTDTIDGGAGNDLLFGGEFNDLLVGGLGNDTLIGNSGNDTLIGVTGADQADGGAGNDLIQSALDVPTDDPVPASAVNAPATPTPVPLSDAVDSTLGINTGLLSHTIGSGTGAGSLTVQVTSTGAFGIGSFPATTSAGAPYDPLGAVAAGDTTSDSEVYFRASTTSGVRSTINSLATNRTTIRGTSSEANSAFEIGSLHFVLTQLAEPVFDLVAATPRVGSLLTQTYRITNTGATTLDFELARYLDGRLRFDGSITDGGGRFVSTAGDEFLLETDAGGTSATSNFVGITAKGGTIPSTNRFQIDQSPALQTNLQAGQDLNGQVFNDTTADQSIDVDYNVSLGLRNTFSLAANASVTYTTHTLFGTGTPNQVQLNQKPVAVADAGRVLEGRGVAIDVVSNDFDAEGNLAYSSIQIAQQPANGTVISLGDGRVDYTPRSGFSGSDTFFYTIADNLGARSLPTLVTVTISAVDLVGDALNGGVGNDTIIGSDGNDTIVGGSGPDSLLGGLGNDRIQGQGGDDTITGGGGADRLDGGDGDDLLKSATASLIINDVTVVEGNVGNVAAVFTVTLTIPSASIVTVDFTTSAGTATLGTDFLPTSGTLTFAPGVTTETITVPVIGETVAELDEIFFVDLANATNAEIFDDQGQATVTDDDTVQVSPNVNISRRAFNQAEVTIAVNPTNVQNMIASGGNLDPAATQDPVWFSRDGGTTWTISFIPNPPGAVAAGDPTIVFDRTGTAYFANLDISANNRLSVARSMDGGQTWTAVTVTTSVAPQSGFIDKEFLSIGPDFQDVTRDRIFLCYHADNIQFIQSSLDGVIWTPPVQVEDNGSRGINAQVGVDATGIVYMTWQELGNPTQGVSRVFVDRSLDGGTTWGPDIVAYTSNVAPFNDIGRVQYTVPAAPDRGIAAYVSIDVDRSTGPNRGTVFIAVLDQGDLDGNAATGHDNTDVFLIRSSDRALTWSSPVRVNNDNTANSQAIPWMDVDQTTGNVAVGWYDARNDDGLRGPGDTNGQPNDDFQFFVGFSTDGGRSFSQNIQASRGASNQSGAEPYPAGFSNFDYGEYVGLDFQNGVAYLVWSDNSNSTGDNPGGTLGTQDIYFASVALGRVVVVTPTATAVPAVEVGDTILGGAGNDTVLGANGNDVINGNAGDDVLGGGAGNDVIAGGAGNDTLSGGDGDDTLDGQGGDDSLLGDAGDDSFVLGNGAGGDDVVEGASGFNQIQVNGTGNADTLSIGQKNGLITAARGLATITALTNLSVQRLTVHALGGDDTVTINDLSLFDSSLLAVVNGGDGNDFITGQGSLLGAVRLALNGDNGNDTILGTNGNDSIDGGAGNDAVNGQAGNDLINGGDGSDTLAGALGNDTVNGGNGNDFLTGHAGDDSLNGGTGSDTLRGFEGNDTLVGAAGDDLLNGMDGDDSILGGVGKDMISGGAGGDTLDGGRNDDTINGNSGNDKIRGDHGNDYIDAGTESDTINGGDGHDTIIATDGNDLLNGGDGNDRINAGGGNDIVTGGDGNDSLIGGGGNDILLGGDGDDYIDGQSGADTVAGNQGVDVIVDPTSEIDELFTLSAAILTLLEAA